MSGLLIYHKCIKILHNKPHKHPANISINYPICNNQDLEFFSPCGSAAQVTPITQNVIKEPCASTKRLFASQITLVML